MLAYKIAESKNITLIVDICNPDSRMQFIASPCRELPLDERQKMTDFSEIVNHGAAFADEPESAITFDNERNNKNSQ